MPGAIVLFWSQGVLELTLHLYILSKLEVTLFYIYPQLSPSDQVHRRLRCKGGFKIHIEVVFQVSKSLYVGCPFLASGYLES